MTVASEDAASAKATGTPIRSNSANTPNRIATAMRSVLERRRRRAGQQTLEREQRDQRAAKPDRQKNETLRERRAGHRRLPVVQHEHGAPEREHRADREDDEARDAEQDDSNFGWRDV